MLISGTKQVITKRKLNILQRSRHDRHPAERALRCGGNLRGAGHMLHIRRHTACSGEIAACQPGPLLQRGHNY
jgi:hypothetical protein